MDTAEITDEVVKQAILKRLNCGDLLYFEIGRWQKPSHAWFNGKPITKLQRVLDLHAEGMTEFVLEKSTTYVGAYTISAKGKRYLEEIEDALQDRRETSNPSVQ